MKSLHLTNSWHESSGGMRTFYMELLKAANREEHLLRLVVPGEADRIEEVGEFGRIYHVRSPAAPFSPAYRMLYPHRFLLPGSILPRILHQEQPEVVEISEKYTLSYLGGMLRTRRLPYVSFRPTVIGTSHERMDENMAAYISSSPAARRFCRWYMKAIYFALFDHHIATSEHTAEELIAVSRGHKVQRGIWVAPMGVDCDWFHPQRRSSEKRQKLEGRLGVSREATLLFYAGRLAPEKNLHLLVETLAILPAGAYHLAIAGQGIAEPTLRENCERRGLRNVSWLGQVKDRGELADLYANSDIFLHPNPREPFGIAPLEAMASGVALVAPDSGGITSYANATNAWLTKPEPEAFAAGVECIRTAESSRSRIMAARETAEQYRWSTVAALHLRLYRELHRRTLEQATETDLPPRALSTPGDAWGRELRPHI